MTFLEALYGSQYAEIKAQGKDGKKGKLNGSLFLTAFLILLLVNVILLLTLSIPLISKGLGNAAKDFFGDLSGRAIGKIIALLLMAIIYFMVSKTVGTEENFVKYVDNYLSYPEEIRNTANKRLLIPFFILLIGMFALGFLN